ncbi:Transposon Ty3-G Gag-Pol polyprotein [Apostichopus japonicus]|uniref:Transposon Ty3-G Gag-Pol polyprotein n=1 Tax=Stichopus japonicus TaxID=307972 RepID=A0A2G8LQZ8_STIJA|nr:Transposon Ty3-G Gag-Pol polyprotein [Apostichopus japonicus]PIK62654.1 Transposon Ty3-G Gag-Pol polyprotein [Apostichopus japonicus]
MLKEQISQMLQLGIIVPSTSEWASPVVMVEKKDGNYRLAINYRADNAVTKQSNYPIPLIQSILHFMYDSQVFSTFDLKSGFWQSAIHPDDQQKTAFVC